MTLPAMLEEDLQTAVVELARHLRYLVYHTHDSRRSTAGFPDLVMVHPVSRALALRGTAYVWRPANLTDGSIARALQRWARLQ